MSSHGQTLLRRYLELLLANTRMEENVRPDWLRGLELDFYFPRLEIAFEFQGDQHYAPVFGQASFEAQRVNDQIKRRLCKERGIELIRLHAADLHLGKIRRSIRRILKARGWKNGRIRLLHKIRKRKLLMAGGGAALNRDAKAYRATLKRSYGSPTVHHPRTKRFGEALRRLNAALAPL